MPAKSLEILVRDRAFRPARHEHLLAGPAVPWPTLSSLQGAYNATDHPLEKRAIAVQFLQAMRSLDVDEATAAAEAAERAAFEEITRGDPIEISEAAWESLTRAL